MIAQVLSFDIFFEKDPHLHAVEYTFFSKEVETPRCSFKWISRVWARIFCKPASNYNLVKKSPIAIFFFVSFIPYPCSVSLWESQESQSLLSWQVKVKRFGIFLKFNGSQFCYSVFLWQISSAEIYLSLLLITYDPKSTLHLDGKLRANFVFCIYYKRNFNYSHTLWI